MMDDVGVGFRFYPTEEELLCYYLPYKLMNLATKPDIDRVIPLLPIYDFNPWDLPQFAGELCPADTEQWFFFAARQEREARGGRPNRLTQTGYWKATGSPSDVYSSQNIRIGRKKTMVFYEGRAPRGTKTSWKMNEYKLYQNTTSFTHHPTQLNDELSLCRIYKRSKRSRSTFDRRPSSSSCTHDEAAVQYYYHNTSTSTSTSTDEAAAAVVITNINDNQHIINGSTQPQAQAQAHVESDQFNWETTEQPLLWDSEFLNWFYEI